MSNTTTSAVPQAVLLVCGELQEDGHQAFVVGGAPRDILLGRPVHDWDVATSATPEQVQAAFRRTVPTGLKHGTVTVLIKTDWSETEEHIEVTTFRGDQGGEDGRHPDSVVFVKTAEEDLARRDFTMNALAMDATTGAMVDPFGGRKDIERRVIRAVGDPNARFAEDGLRVMRAVRFAATLGFELDPATKAAIPAALPTFRKVSAERIRDELVKMLAAPKPSVGVELMRETGLLAEVLPELLPLVGMEQNHFHAFDGWQHTMVALDAAAPDVRFAALIHDVGKPRTREPKEDAPGEFSFHGHDAISAQMADEIMRRLKFSNEEREFVCNLVQHHMAFVRQRSAWTPSAVRRFIRKVGAENMEPLLRLRAADIAGNGIPSRTHEEETSELRAKIDAEMSKPLVTKARGLAVSGKDIMEVLGCKPGPVVGKVLRALEERVLDDPDLNAAARLREMIPEAAAAC